MAVYAIGDVQGCYDDLQRLLDALQFDDKQDTLWFAGDIINRGPQSLETIRFIKALDKHAITILGNHDLNLLAVAEGVRQLKPLDTLDDILNAPDRDELLDWLRHCPFAHYDSSLNYLMLHAGIPPQWNFDTTLALAKEAQAALQTTDYKQTLQGMYGDTPKQWSNQLTGIDRFRVITNCFTRMRFCDASGNLDLTMKGAPGKQPESYKPWYEFLDNSFKNINIVFGHWSTIGDTNNPQVSALDTGCVWGGKLTAQRLDATPANRTCIQCQGSLKP